MHWPPSDDAEDEPADESSGDSPDDLPGDAYTESPVGDAAAHAHDALPGDDVLAANEEFYRSLESLDIERMGRIWLPTEWVTCVHPGWSMLTGWTAVRESWTKIFQNTETIRFELSELGVRVESATAWVTCYENILHLSSAGVAGASAAATNIFIRTADGWRIALHHASPIPDGVDAPGVDRDSEDSSGSSQ